LPANLALCATAAVRRPFSYVVPNTGVRIRTFPSTIIGNSGNMSAT